MVTLLIGGVVALWVGPLTSLDVAGVEAVYYDAQTGAPLFASNARLAQAANATHPSPTLFGRDRPAFTDSLLVRVGAQDGPVDDFAGQMSPHLVGRRAGDRIVTPPVEFGRWERNVSVPRVHGPFPLEHEYPRARLETLLNGTVAVGVRFADPRVAEAELEATHVNETTVRYRSLLREGDVIRIQTVDWPARVFLDEELDAFTLRLDPVVGSASGLACTDPLTGLETGSYQVLGVNETRITLAYSSLRYPSLVERPVYAHIHVTQVHKLGRLIDQASKLFPPSPPI